MRTQAVIVATLLALTLTLVPELSTAAAQQNSGTTTDIIVCSTCETSSLVDAIAGAEPGARIEVRGGTYPGGLEISHDIVLIGIDNPVIDAGGVGSAIQVTGANVVIQGFTIRGTGTSLHHEDTAIVVESGVATIIGNVIEDALFGIYLKDAHGSVVRDNRVMSKPLPVAQRGDGIRVWYSNDVVIENNIAQDGRDVILWYSDGGEVRNNFFDRNRYGLHLMFSSDTLIEGNSLESSSIGLFIMYSEEVIIRGNAMSNNHGPSGGGLGLKDVNGAVIEGNRFVNNRIAAQVDNSPLNPSIEHVWRNNVFAYNEIGLGLLPSTRQNTWTENAFIDNIQNVTVLGGGELRDLTWSVEGRGNYWSDYAGYDANGDGAGDLPYRSQQLFESLMDDHPNLRLFLFSPAAMAIDFASDAFPAVRPRVKFEDDAPLMSPPVMVGLPRVEKASGTSRVVGGTAGILMASAAFVTVAAIRRRHRGPADTDIDTGTTRLNERVMNRQTTDIQPEMKATSAMTASGVISVRDLSKHYGRTAVVNDVTFNVQPGEVIALWGPNGAGKTTILRCLLGIARYSGSIRIHGIDPLRDGRAARQHVGYVPQDLAPSAMTVGEMADFVVRLKKAGSEEAVDRLRKLGIDDQLDKMVSDLSGGMKQRLALALALIGNPSILLLDEPTASLDAGGRAELLQLLQGLKSDGITLVFSSHRLDDVLTLADRVLVIERGAAASMIAREIFASDLNNRSRLVVTLTNGHMQEALDTLARMGLEADSSGKVLSVAISPNEKARVLSALVRQGVDIQDFDIESERAPWTG